MPPVDRAMAEKLRLAPVGARVATGGETPEVSVNEVPPRQYPCWRCVFLPLKEASTQCPMLAACAGRYRPDRRSVRFTRPDGRRKK